MVGRSEPDGLRERHSLAETLELGVTAETDAATSDARLEASLSENDLVASPAQLAFQEILTQAVQGVLNQNDSKPELVTETDPEAVTRAINALGQSPNASDLTRVGDAEPPALKEQSGYTLVASSSSSSSSEHEVAMATRRSDPDAQAGDVPTSDSSSASQTEALGKELHVQHSPEISSDLSAEEKSSVRATAQQSLEEAEPNVSPGSPDTPENESSSRSERLDTPLDEQLASPEGSHLKSGRAGRPSQANAEAARLLTLRGLRRILESCTSRKYAETVACCRRAIEKLEVGSEPDTNEVLEAIKKASRCGKIAAADIALDTLHRLLAYGFFDPLRGATIEAEQFENLIETACSCIDTKDEGVYIRLTQVLLASATSTLFGLHQTILLAAVRTLYNIYLSSKASATQTTARAAIIQVVNVVFGPLRNAPIPAETIFVSDALEPTATLAGAALVHQAHRRQREGPTNEAGETTDSPRSQSSTNTGTKPLLDLEPIEQCQKDAYLLFRALCKLASKRISENSSLPTESLPVRSRLLALQLIRDIIDACGPALLQHERFVFSLREYLTPTVLQNCMVQNQSVLNTALQLFERMIRLYRAVLKLEIAALFHAVVFRFLESPTVAPWQRLRIYQTIQATAEDQQLLMDLFLNYDCDMHSPKLYERLVDDLCRIAISALQVGGARKFTAADRRACLGILATMLHSLKDWSQPLVDARRQLGVDDEDMFHALSEPSMPESSDEGSAGLSAGTPTSLGVAPEATRSSRAQGSALMLNGGLASSSERSLMESLRRKRELHEIAEAFQP
ncbi:ADP-ribosylation factor guanine nucleotide-exchange factor [Cyanidiococcus yangmingshanensis]|uniref:ADP-ribosylation factor guanine nucleotide-exchange factor n=1 Tax=Cyanidiococcus yangmingshanensis TaxID=2690220 RepID=A0A7J7IMS4_9RHOD|nr:ADP-ribosylation factor guanine nucleotide-exchange factor [Cyanidiococcus yangmingshanensis]